MAMFKDDSVRLPEFERFVHETPSWFSDAKLGIFVHWGAYSVAAWAEPIGELGADDHAHDFARNPYAEWYFNTIRIEGSPAQQHHQETFGDVDYDHLLDLWRAENFDADEVLALVKHTGARYFVPTTKHHDGITLWDAPETDGRNTVARGPKRDLIGEFAEATERAGLKFGVYYSGGLDWHHSPSAPVVETDGPDGWTNRANDEPYAEYAHKHVADLIERYRLEVLWNDIEWPDPGKDGGEHGLVSLFDRFYTVAPDGLINDRWGDTHWDYRTTEYQMGEDINDEPWENCRGIGYSFGHNTLEDETHLLSGEAAIRYFADIVARGGNLLLNIGLQADGTVPVDQRATLETLGDWNAVNGAAIFGSRQLDASIASGSESPWTRWTRTGDTANAIIDADGPVTLSVSIDAVATDSARLLDGTPVTATVGDGGVTVELPKRSAPGPQVVVFDLV
ncbi:MAG TPA: alpha-L-fucosidase [Plantibacter sp.]|uniref:alpha-L-fucosidase n=1 Tax=Plantibacter sp. TaxID=1871045 RepID=UPI002C50DFA8|nr:alpha-L-fucosidase [Plantibacter sp.]